MGRALRSLHGHMKYCGHQQLMDNHIKRTGFECEVYFIYYTLRVLQIIPFPNLALVKRGDCDFGTELVVITILLK